MTLLRWIFAAAWRQMHWLVRCVYIAAVVAPVVLPLLARRLGWNRLDEILPWWSLIGISMIVFFGGLLLAIAARAKATEQVAQDNVLNPKEAETIHDFLKYVGLTVGDVSDESNRVAHDGLTHLRNLAAAGTIPVWGIRVYPGETFEPARPALKIPKEYWEAASISSLSALENRDPMFLKTTPENFGVSTHKGAVFSGLRVYRSAIRQYFRKNEYKPRPHKPVFRR
jgi:hypothetical protein